MIYTILKIRENPCLNREKSLNLRKRNVVYTIMADLNRIKVVLVEKKRTNKWLAQQLGKDPATVSKWCTNVSQPDLLTLNKIANALDVDVRELINKSKE